MNWEAIGAAAELLSAIGVIASLFYLASQIRRNSESVEAATALSISEATQHRLLIPAQSAELAAAIVRAASGDKLSDTERAQVSFFTRASLRGIENVFTQHRRGMISAEVFSGYKALLETNVGLGVVEGWWALERQTSEPEFRGLVDQLLKEPPAAYKRLQLTPNSSFQSIHGTVLAAGAVPQRWRSALLGAAEPPVR